MKWTILFDITCAKLKIQMPQMKLEKDTEDNFLRFVVQNLGMTTGFTIMVILAIFEDDITNV